MFQKKHIFSTRIWEWSESEILSAEVEIDSFSVYDMHFIENESANDVEK